MIILQKKEENASRRGSKPGQLVLQSNTQPLPIDPL